MNLRVAWRLVAGMGLLAFVGLAGCSTAPSPTRTAIERGDARAMQNEQRLAPQASHGRGLLVAGDGFGRMAYSGQPTTTQTASADDDGE